METREAMNKAIDKYQYLQEETCWLELQAKDLIVINWPIFMNEYISEYRVRKIANFLHKLLPNISIYSAVKQYY